MTEIYDYNNEIKNWIEAPEEKVFKFSHIPDLNKALGEGIPEGSMNIVLGRSGFGKTNFLVDTAVNLAASAQVVMFASVEMTFEKLTPRIMASVSKYPISTFLAAKTAYKKDPNSPECQVFDIAQSMASCLPLKTIYDKTIEAIVDQAILGKYDYGVTHLVVDHFNELITEKKFNNDLDRQRYIIAKLEELYSEHNITIFIAAQFKKGLERGLDHGERDRDDIRGPSEFATKSTNIIYLYETEEQNKQNKQYEGLDTPTRCTIKLMKARQGFENFATELFYDRARATFKPTK